MTANLSESGWFAVGGVRDLPPGFARAVTLRGQDIALWRSAGGRFHAWRNRCIHRGMRLSLGFVRGEQLVCRYHGWHYDGAGACRLIPAHPRRPAPENVRVETYATAEQSDLLWIRLAEGKDAPPDLTAMLGTAPAFCQSFHLPLDQESLAGQLGRIPYPPSELESPWDWQCELSRAEPDTMTALWRSARSGQTGPLALSYRVRRPSPSLVAVTVCKDDGPLETRISALQPIDDAQTVLHLLVSLSDGDSRGARSAVAQWGRQLRSAIHLSGAAA